MDKLSLKNKDWKDFYLSDFFDFEKGNQNNMASLTTGTLPLVSAKKTDNGYKGFVSKEQKKIFREFKKYVDEDRRKSRVEIESDDSFEEETR